MFKIIDYRNSSGKILITIETDDLTSSLFLQFLSEADKFAELFHYRLTIEKRIDSSQKNKPEQLARATKSSAALLKKYKEIIGSPQQRLKILRQMCITEGIEITQDRLAAKLQLATEEEILHKQTPVKMLKRKDKTLDDIASALSIPKSTVARYAGRRKPRNDRR
jgi:hypothetical protein